MRTKNAGKGFLYVTVMCAVKLELLDLGFSLSLQQSNSKPNTITSQVDSRFQVCLLYFNVLSLSAYTSSTNPSHSDYRRAIDHFATFSVFHDRSIEPSLDYFSEQNIKKVPRNLTKIQSNIILRSGSSSIISRTICMQLLCLS
jgi:hypothetical protein